MLRDRKKLRQTTLDDKVVKREPFTMEVFEVPTETHPVKKLRRKQQPKAIEQTGTQHSIPQMTIPFDAEKKVRYEHVGSGYVRLLPPYTIDFMYDVSRLIFPIWAIDRSFERPRAIELHPTGQVRLPAGLRHRCREGLYDADCLYDATLDQ